jgi:hypothetical protein
MCFEIGGLKVAITNIVISSSRGPNLLSISALRPRSTVDDISSIVAGTQTPSRTSQR